MSRLRRAFGDLGQGLGAVFHPDQFELGERFLVNLVLEVVVFDNQNNRLVHGLED